MNDLAELMRLGQPKVSKHLRVLREVGLVDVRATRAAGGSTGSMRGR